MALHVADIIADAVEAKGIRRLTIAPRLPFSYAAGQVVHLTADARGGYFAIASAPSEGPSLTLLVKVIGSGSEFAAARTVGDEVTIEGPFGAGYPIKQSDAPAPPERMDLLLIAAGTGIAPLRAALVADQARTRLGKTRLLYGVRHANERCFQTEVAAWREDGVEVREVVSQPNDAAWTGRIGRVQAHLDGLVTPATTVFVAGPPAMEVDVIEALVALGVPKARCWTNVDPDAFG